MPDPTGFLHFDRRLPPRRPAEQRPHDWNEVYPRAADYVVPYRCARGADR